MNSFKVSAIDYALDKTVTFTVKGKLSVCSVNGMDRRCIVNEYDIPIFIECVSNFIYT